MAYELSVANTLAKFSTAFPVLVAYGPLDMGTLAKTHPHFAFFS
jgi:hypothetical protein